MRSQEAFHARADALRFANRLHNPFIRPKERRLAELVADEIPPTCRAILEVGSGEGANLHYLQTVVPHLHLIGLDFSQEKIRFQMRHVQSTWGIVGDALSLPFRSRSVDFVLGRDLLHHLVPKRSQAIREIHRILRPGGRAVFFESDGRACINGVFQLMYPVERGMRLSQARSLPPLFSGFAKCQLKMIEASFAVRALGFLFGYPRADSTPLLWLAFRLAQAWETALEYVLPTDRWTYMMVVAEK